MVSKRGFTTGVLLGFTVAGLAACGSDDMNNSQVPGPDAPPNATLKLATSSTLGSYLVDGTGRTLYLFERDIPAGAGQDASSNCVANPDPKKSCVAFWPIFHADPLVVSGIDKADVGEIMRPDGLKQTTYKGFPLYTYAGDKNPGDTMGDASNGGGTVPVWYAVRSPAYTVLSLTDAQGTRLTDGAGRTLYYFTPDTVGDHPTSACNGAAGDPMTCLGNWPVFSTSSIVVPTGVDKARFSSFTRSDGKPQLAFDGHPLYYFVNDKVPGDQKGLTFGPGLGYWYTLDPNQSNAPTIKTATHNGDPFTGDYLVDGNGNTLYYFAKDLPAFGSNAAVSNCVANADPTKSCLAFWPVFHTDRVIVEGINANDVGQFTRPDNMVQTTYKGFPLYHFANDAQPGDLKGEASKGGNASVSWFVLRNPAYTELVLSKTTEDPDYLVDATGMSLYFYSKDTVGGGTTAPESKCTTATCLASFKPYFSATGVVPSSINPNAFTLFTRADNGLQQLAYKGHPLYLFNGDQKPGDTAGRNMLDTFNTVDPTQP